MPKYLSSDNDPLYRFHQWQANLRILEVTEIKSVPYVPLSHPFVERLIGTLRREYLDHILFWTTADLENKLLDFRTYFNNHRTHDSLKDERRIRPCLDQSQISARSVGNHTVAPCTRRRWPPDLSESRPGCGIRSTSAELPRNRSLFSYCNALPRSDRFRYRCVPKVELNTLSQRHERQKWALVAIRQTHEIANRCTSASVMPTA
jgi:hypothetical protein